MAIKADVAVDLSTGGLAYGEVAPDGVRWGSDCAHSAHIMRIEDVWEPCGDPKCKYREPA